MLSAKNWYQSNIGRYYRFNHKIAYLNINSVMNNIDEVKDMLNREMFDIFLLPRPRSITPFLLRSFCSRVTVLFDLIVKKELRFN